MRKVLILAAAGLTITFANSSANAQVDLSAYADAEGYIDVQALTCAQLAGTWQDQADLLTTWYSGWYNGLAKKHLAKPDRAKRLEHEIIVHCKSGVRSGKAVDLLKQQGFKYARNMKGGILAWSDKVDPTVPKY